MVEYNPNEFNRPKKKMSFREFVVAVIGFVGMIVSLVLLILLFFAAIYAIKWLWFHI